MSLRYRVYTCKPSSIDQRILDHDEEVKPRRATTAAADLHKQSNKIKLIGTLRHLLKSTAHNEHTAKSDVADEHPSRGNSVSYNKFRAGLKTRGFTQSPNSHSAEISERTSTKKGDCTQQLYRSSTSLPDVKYSKRLSSNAEKLLSKDIASVQGPTATAIHLGEPVQSVVSQVKETNQDETTPKPMSYSQQLRVLKGKKMELLRMSLESSIAPSSSSSLKKTLMIGGKGVNNFNQPTIDLKHHTPLSSMSNLTNYSNVLAYTKYRASAISSAPSKGMHSKHRPAIIIPCHTNTVCTYCQLYDDDKHENHEQESISSELPWSSLGLGRSLKSERLAKINLSLKEELNGKDMKSVKSSKKFGKKSGGITEMERVRVSDATGATVQATDMSSLPDPCYLEQNGELNPGVEEYKVSSESSEMPPIIYRLRYTKSSVESMRTSSTAAAIH